MRLRRSYRRLTREELTALAGEELPDAAVSLLLEARVAAPENLVRALRGRHEDGERAANRKR